NDFEYDRLKLYREVRTFEPEVAPPHQVPDQPLRARHSGLGRRAEPEMYIVIARDSSNEAETAGTWKFLNSIVTDKNMFIIEMLDEKRRVEAWGSLTLDDD
ncbi:hypothetical protein K469DRAFT_553270, partial [Zopfia rhizophila CBS 207.26]